MTTAILIALIFVAGLLGAYTLKFQQATLALGKRLASENPFLPTGFQDAITPKIQTTRNIIYPILILVILVYGIMFYKWYLGLAFAILTFFILIPILKLTLPKVDSDFYKGRIKKDLLKRLSQYKKAGDGDREIAINEILARFVKLE